MTNLLITNPLEDEGLKPCLRSLVAVPAVKPGIAHALATNYGSLGGLMDMLLDPGRRAGLRGGRWLRALPHAARTLPLALLNMLWAAARPTVRPCLPRMPGSCTLLLTAELAPSTCPKE